MADLISVIIGGALAVGGGLLSQSWQHRRDRSSLAHALAGEIHAIVDIVERRHYQDTITTLIEKVVQTKAPMILQVGITQKYFVVYESNAAKIGLLPSHAAKNVAVFYTLAKSVIEDATLKQFPQMTADESIARLLQTQGLIAEMNKLGKTVVQELENI